MTDARDLRSVLDDVDRSISRVLRCDGSPRVAFAHALGRARGGERVTLHLTDDDLLACIDLLREAVRTSAPLLLRVDARVDHRVLWHAAEQGAVALFARDPQEAVDLTLVARRISEFALVPVVLGDDLGEPLCAVEVPSEMLRARTVGRADDSIGTPTRTQKLLFGERRRRLLRSFDLDRPVLLGASRSKAVEALADAARAAYREQETAEICVQSLAEVARATDRPLSTLDMHRADDARVLIVCAGHAATLAVAVANEQRRQKHAVGVVTVATLRPFDDAGLRDALRGAQDVLVVDRARIPQDGGSCLTREVARVLRGNERRGLLSRGAAPRLRTAVFGPAATAEDLAAFVDAVQKGDDRDTVFLGVDFAPRDPGAPKRQALFDRLRRDHEGLDRLGVRAARKAVTASRAPSRAPRGLQPLSRPSDAHDSLPRFWDQVGAMVHADDADALAPDPYLAHGSVPPASAVLFGDTITRGTLVSVDTSLCTGCGACWTACPDGALAPVAMRARALLEAGLDRASRSGRSADALRMLLGKLAQRFDPRGHADVGSALRAAWNEVAAKAAPDAERRAALDSAFDALLEAVGALPLAGAVDGFGDHLLGLALDADACKSCGLCVRVCDAGAIHDAARTPETVQRARAGWSCFEELPDTEGATIEALRGDGKLGVAAASNLSRHVLLPMASGDAAEPGSGARLALRTLLGVVEIHGQPRLREQITAFGELEERFGARIREELGRALPTGDLAALQEGLDALGRADVALADLALRVDAAVGTGRVDGTKLGRLVTTARELADRRFALQTGAQGLGRARCGIALLPEIETEWARRFPANPFVAPVAVVGPAEARGLAEGMVEEWLDDQRLLRRARLELDRPGEALHAATRLHDLGLRDLDAKERTGVPPLVVVGTAARLLGDELGATLALLRSELPVVVVALAGARGSCGDATAVALAARERFVAQSNVAAVEHLFGAMVAALRRAEPALLVVGAPSPSADGHEPARMLEVARAMVDERRLPLFTFDPARGAQFGARFALDGNPEESASSSTPADLARWRTLLELAGVESPATDRVRAELRAEAEARRAAERLQERVAVERELAGRLRDKLTTLALRGRR